MIDWTKPFPVLAISREQLRGKISDEHLARLTDEDMTKIASELRTVYEKGGWLDHAVIVTQMYLLFDKKE